MIQIVELESKFQFFISSSSNENSTLYKTQNTHRVMMLIDIKNSSNEILESQFLSNALNTSDVMNGSLTPINSVN